MLRLTSKQIVRLKNKNGDVALMKNDAYQGKQKVKDQWSETEYVVVCQVTDGVPTYEVKDEAGNVNTVHHN